MSLNVTIACPCCGRPVEVGFRPAIPGRTAGPPERCYPPEPAEWEFFDPEAACECSEYLDSIKGGYDRYDEDILTAAERAARDRQEEDLAAGEAAEEEEYERQREIICVREVGR